MQLVKFIYKGTEYHTKLDDDAPSEITTTKWYLHSAGYAVNSKRQYLHHFVMKPEKGYDIDHINRDKLDNRKSNLRLVTRSENRINTGKQVNNTSGHKNITKEGNSWRVQFQINKEYIRLGSFKSIGQAIKARDEWRNSNAS